MTDEQRKAHARDLMRRWRAHRKQLGLCLQCGTQLEARSHVRCVDCRAIVALKMRDRRVREMLSNPT